MIVTLPGFVRPFRSSQAANVWKSVQDGRASDAHEKRVQSEVDDPHGRRGTKVSRKGSHTVGPLPQASNGAHGSAGVDAGGTAELLAWRHLEGSFAGKVGHQKVHSNVLTHHLGVDVASHFSRHSRAIKMTVILWRRRGSRCSWFVWSGICKVKRLGNPVE